MDKYHEDLGDRLNADMRACGVQVKGMGRGSESERSGALAKFARAHSLALPLSAGVEEGPSDADGDLLDKLWIEVVGDGRLMSAFAKDVGFVLSRTGVYRRDRSPVTINHESGAMEELEEHRFRSYVEKDIVCWKWKAYGKSGLKKEPVTMSAAVARGCLSSDFFIDQLRPLLKVNYSRMPIMRPDGTMELLKEGYDSQGRFYTMPSGIAIDETMPLEKAVAILRDYLKEFPFEDERSRAVQLAAMLAMFGANLLPLTSPRMNFVYDANKPRSGKTLLAVMALAPVCGEVAVRTLPEKEKDLETVIEAATLGSKPYLLLDDLEGTIKNRTLNAFLTASHVDVRIFHTQRSVSVPKVSTVFMTGNNLNLSPDIAGRSLVCKLFVEEADVQGRKINRVISFPYLYRPHIRGEFLSALWAIVRFWAENGRPSGAAALQGFQEWSEIFGGMVQLAGFEDPLQPMKEDASLDPQFEDMRALVTSLLSAVPADDKLAYFEFDELVKKCRELNCFPAAIDGKEKVEKDGTGRVIATHFDLSAKSRSILGKIFTDRYGGSIFHIKLEGGILVKVKFGNRGRKRDKRYLLSVVD